MVGNVASVFVPLWVCVSVLSVWEFQDNVVGQVIFGISSCLVDHASVLEDFKMFASRMSQPRLFDLHRRQAGLIPHVHWVTCRRVRDVAKFVLSPFLSSAVTTRCRSSQTCNRCDWIALVCEYYTHEQSSLTCTWGNRCCCERLKLPQSCATPPAHWVACVRTCRAVCSGHVQIQQQIAAKHSRQWESILTCVVLSFPCSDECQLPVRLLVSFWWNQSLISDRRAAAGMFRLMPFSVGIFSSLSQSLWLPPDIFVWAQPLSEN